MEYNEGAGMCAESTHSIFLSTGSRQVLLEQNEGAGKNNSVRESGAALLQNAVVSELAQVV